MKLGENLDKQSNPSRSCRPIEWTGEEEEEEEEG